MTHLSIFGKLMKVISVRWQHNEWVIITHNLEFRWRELVFRSPLESEIVNFILNEKDPICDRDPRTKPGWSRTEISKPGTGPWPTKFWKSLRPIRTGRCPDHGGPWIPDLWFDFSEWPMTNFMTRSREMNLILNHLWNVFMISTMNFMNRLNSENFFTIKNHENHN